jgi:16S rRNA (guanine527-N7)-methyltransferase
MTHDLAYMDRTSFVEVARRLGLELDERQIDAFEQFESSLYETNQVMNLTRVPREEAWLRHFVDSILFHDLIPTGVKVLDIGTGPGFPAWPLAVARPDLNVTALDSNGKMLGFLRRHPLDNLSVVQGRAEEWGVREQFDVVTGRAVAPLSIQLELSAPACRVGGKVIPMRSESEESSCAGELGLVLADTISRSLPGTDAIRVFPVFVKERKTPGAYPRRWAEIKRKPL